MSSNYEEISEENDREAKAQLKQVISEIVVPLYSDSTHFILELLQNAEDAMQNRKDWKGSKSVDFLLHNDYLRVSHYGSPFSKEDVKSICKCAYSNKKDTQIGKFGIGFKSVYDFTERPVIHSGNENFAIEGYTNPVAEKAIEGNPDETVIVLPFKAEASEAHENIKRGLRSLGTRSLLFLREINEITWRSFDGHEGVYMRVDPKNIGKNVQHVELLGKETGQPDTEEEYLMFSKPVSNERHPQVGYVETAFMLSNDSKDKEFAVNPIKDAKLIVSFPTAIETHTGFLIQGPYHTTPSRDNVLERDSWNQHLVMETGSLLVEALRWLRDNNSLDVGVLESLPLDQETFNEEHRLRPLYDCSVKALASESLLPRHEGGYVSAAESRLARTGELRELFLPEQLAQIYGADSGLHWLSGAITEDRTPQIRDFLMRDLKVAEITPERITRLLNKEFFEAQSDNWIMHFYKYASGIKAVRDALLHIPFIRLESGEHVFCADAFLPSQTTTNFSTVRATLCDDPEVMDLLKFLGLKEPDAVDDVIKHVLPKYEENEAEISEDEYESDIQRILGAHNTDSKEQEERLISALKKTAFVAVIDAKSGVKSNIIPGAAYMATSRIKELFDGVEGVRLVDESHKCLHGEPVRNLLEAGGVNRYLQPVQVESSLDSDDLENLRIREGFNKCSYNMAVIDYTLRGLGELLDALPNFDPETRSKKAKLLWRSLCELPERRRADVFLGTYKWFYHEPYTARFDAEFIRILNAREWVPGQDGALYKPRKVLFENLDWKAMPSLLEKIQFKIPPEIGKLAQEAGIEPAVIELLKRLGLTSLSELKSHLDIDDSEEPSESGVAENNENKDEAPSGGDETQPEESDPDTGGVGPTNQGGQGGNGQSSGGNKGGGQGTPPGDGAGAKGTSGKKGDSGRKPAKPASPGKRTFVSYVAVTPEDTGPDPEGLTHGQRMSLEKKAIDFIIAKEPALQRTPPNNPGFDLYEKDANDEPVRWVEVKSMKWSLANHPVGISKTQFEFAREHGKACWLYIVQYADSDDPKLIPIQDPVGLAKTFTFDKGWAEISEADK